MPLFDIEEDHIKQVSEQLSFYHYQQPKNVTILKLYQIIGHVSDFSKIHDRVSVIEEDVNKNMEKAMANLFDTQMEIIDLTVASTN